MNREELEEKITEVMDLVDNLDIGTGYATEKIMSLIDEYTKPKGKSLEERGQAFFENVLETAKEKGEYYCDMVQDFVDYWTEHNEGGKKMRFEMAKNQPFNIKRRLVTWAKRSKNYNNGTTTESTTDKLRKF